MDVEHSDSRNYNKINNSKNKTTATTTIAATTRKQQHPPLVQYRRGTLGQQPPVGEERAYAVALGG